MRRGFSLAEMLVAVALGVILSILLYQALVAAIRITARSSERSKVQLEATVVWDRLGRDLRNTDFGQLIIVDLPAPAGQGLLVPMLDGIAASGTREWSKNQILLHWDQSSKELHRRLVLEPAVEHTNPLAGFLALLQTPDRVGDRTLSNCLKRFRAGLTPANLCSLEMTFEMTPGREWKLAGSIGARN